MFEAGPPATWRPPDCNTIGMATSLGSHNRSVGTTLGRVEDLRPETLTGRVGHSTRAWAIGPGEPKMVGTGCVPPCAVDTDAVFSPDGTRLVFVRCLTG